MSGDVESVQLKIILYGEGLLMGHLRTKSFLIFSDSDAPPVKTYDSEEIAKIEAEHESAKSERFEGAIRSWSKKLDNNTDKQRKIVARVQEVGADEEAFKEYMITTLSSRNEYDWREFARAIRAILISKADLSPDRYVPRHGPQDTVRFSGDGYFVINQEPDGTVLTEENEIVLDGSTYPALWVKVVDGWSESGDWGGCLQITCNTENGRYIDSSDGWVKSVAEKVDMVTFYDMGNYYEIWQKDRETGRPLIIEEDRLRFVSGATPQKWNIQDSTWD